MTANTARVGVTLYSCVRSLRGLLLGLNTQLRFPGLFSSSVGERTLMNHFVVKIPFRFGCGSAALSKARHNGV
jgi:hypothetical protein